MKISELPTLCSDLYKDQSTWKNNCKKTLFENHDKIEKLLKKSSVFDIWSACLPGNKIAEKLLPEMYIDAYSSINFSSISFYKYAYMCLRSELETGLRFLFFYHHPIEFEWWLNGSEWYFKQNKGQVWGDNYYYFYNIGKIKEFESKCRSHLRLVSEPQLMRKEYSKLSQYTHSGAQHFQTEYTRLTPTYDVAKFSQWYNIYETIQCYLNILFLFGLYNDLMPSKKEEYKKITDLTINRKYKGTVESFF